MAARVTASPPQGRFAVTGDGTEHEHFDGMGTLLLGYPPPGLRTFFNVPESFSLLRSVS